MNFSWDIYTNKETLAQLQMFSHNSHHKFLTELQVRIYVICKSKRSYTKRSRNIQFV